MAYHSKATHLIALTSDIVKIANQLNDELEQSIVDARDGGGGEEPAEQSAEHLERKLLVTAQNIYKVRRHREKVFGGIDIFSDPAWDMLLDLFSAHISGKKISVTSACIAANAPTTTALRWIAVLENAGLLGRERDPVDARRIYVQLTPSAIEKLTNVFEDMG